MARYLLLAMNGPTQGDEEAYHQWYEKVHLPDFREMEEVISARRFKTLRGQVPGLETPWPYVVAYEIETEDFAGFSKNWRKRCSHSRPRSIARGRPT